MMSFRPVMSAVAILVILGCLQPANGGDMVCGGWSPVQATNTEVIAAAECAIRAQNAKAAASDTNTVSLVRITSARHQVVAGINFALSIDVRQGKNERPAETIVWHRLSGEYELTSWRWSTCRKAEPPAKGK